MARGSARLSEDLLAESSRFRRPQPPAAASTRSEAADWHSCKEHPGSRSKAFSRRGLAGRPFGRRSCKEHLGFFQALNSASPSYGDPPCRGILKRTSSWSFDPSAFTNELAMLSPEQINEIHRLHL